MGGFILPFWTCVFIFGTGNFQVVISDSRNIFVKKLVNCRGFENAPLQWSEVAVERDSTTKGFTFSLKLKVLKEVSTKFAGQVDIWMCDSDGSVNSCEYFLKEYRNNNICAVMTKTNQLWSPFVQRFEPVLECPIKKGTYKMNKCPFKNDFLKFMPIKESFWKARLKGFDSNQTISCVDFEMKLVADRKGQ